MANINQTLKARQLAEEAKKAAEEAKKPAEWQETAEQQLKDAGKVVRATIPSIANSIAATGYPKNLKFGYANVTVMDEEDLAKFWKTIYSNLSKKELAALAEPNHKPLTEWQVSEALMRSAQRISVANDLVENGIQNGAIEFENDGHYYVLAAKMVIGLDGQVICDVSDLNEPYGPEEWVEIAKRIERPNHNGYDDAECPELEYSDYEVVITDHDGGTDNDSYTDYDSGYAAFEAAMGEYDEVEFVRNDHYTDGSVESETIEYYYKEDGEM